MPMVKTSVNITSHDVGTVSLKTRKMTQEKDTTVHATNTDLLRLRKPFKTVLL